MTEKVKNAYDALHMNDACVQAIEDAMARKAAVLKRRQRLRYALAACLTLVLLLVLSNPSTVAKAVNFVKNQVLDIAREAGFVEAHSVYSADGMTLVSGTDRSGGTATAGSYDGSAPSCLSERDGRLYFLTDEGELDISDSFSEDEPFVYTFYIGKLIKYVAIGGTYTPDTNLEGVGWAVVVRKALEDPAPLEGWITAYARGRTLPMKEDFAPWYLKAMDIFEYPILH